MFWEFIKSSLFFRILYIASSLTFLYFYARNLNFFKFIDVENELKELNSKISCITKLKKEDKTIPIPTKNNDELKQEYNSLQEQNVSLSSNISSLTKEKDSLEKKKMELTTTNNNLQEKFEEVKNINDDFIEEKQEWEEKLKIIKTDIAEVENENEALKKKVM